MSRKSSLSPGVQSADEKQLGPLPARRYDPSFTGPRPSVRAGPPPSQVCVRFALPNTFLSKPLVFHGSLEEWGLREPLTLSFHRAASLITPGVCVQSSAASAFTDFSGDLLRTHLGLMDNTIKMGWIGAVVICLSCLLMEEVSGHGRLIEPPSRATMWRYGFSTPPDYQDHELFCGGFTRQWQSNGGKCGICGDPWDAPQPRAHEAGGKYAQGIIVRRYKMGSTVPIRVELTANHKGYFEFRLCPQNNHRKEATQACLDRYILERGDSIGGTRVFPGIEAGGGNRIFEARYRLPDGLTCSQCVLQWRYIAGNSWGMCANGTGAVGCGPQEEFRACADVSIQSDSGLFDNTPYDGEGEEEEGEGEVDNEIPQGKEDAKSGKAGEVVEEEAEEEEGLFWWGVVLLVVGCAFVAAAALFALLYLYYYHARDGFKKWLKKEEKRRIGVAVVVPVVPEEPPMVPPRRSRKNSFSDERVV